MASVTIIACVQSASAKALIAAVPEVHLKMLMAYEVDKLDFVQLPR